MKKQSIKQYRTIENKRFVMWTADTSKFDESKELCRQEGKKYRIIADQFYIEY